MLILYFSILSIIFFVSIHFVIQRHSKSAQWDIWDQIRWNIKPLSFWFSWIPGIWKICFAKCRFLLVHTTLSSVTWYWENFSYQSEEQQEQSNIGMLLMWRNISISIICFVSINQGSTHYYDMRQHPTTAFYVIKQR